MPAPRLTAYARRTPPSDSFAGAIANGSGRWAGDQNRVKVYLHPGAGSATGTRALTVTVSSSPCAGRRHCLALSGTLKGKLVAERMMPDRGRTDMITATGTVKPLGQASASGTVTGTGNIRFGHESLSLTLGDRTGKVTIAAQSPQVPGFTSP